jgi:class 3 adenylate cyclase/TolB-like protein
MTPPPDLERRLAAFWFADIAGFTALSARDERAALDAVDALRRGAREQIERAGGRLVKVSGDAVLAEFSSSDSALRSALALRDSLSTTVPLHIGVHLGEVSENHGDIYGDGVNTAARLQTRAEAGQVLASEDVFRHVRANPAFRFEPAGTFELKGLTAPITAYAVELSQSAAGPRVSVDARPTGARASDSRPKSTRLIVAPFRLLRPDEETSFLAYSLADAVSFSLSNLQSVVVRSSNVAGGGGTAALDPREVARKTDVDLVVTGTLLRVGDRVQVTAELSDGEGTRLGSFRMQAGMGDLFDLQDDMTRQIVESLQLKLTSRERSLLQHDVPATPEAYELYLRANELSFRLSDWYTPRDLYLAALAEDPSYAPAWAQLGRCYRLIAKYGPREVRRYNFNQAEAALKKALELNPDLDRAHGYAAQLETDLGRCGEAMVRLLERLSTRPQGVDLLSSLVQPLRYCGLLQESLAADAEARAIDPSARTSVAYTYFMLGDYEKAASSGTATDFFLNALALLVQGRQEEARKLLADTLHGISPMLRSIVRPIELLAAGDHEGSTEVGRAIYRDFPDPEGRFLFARDLAWVGCTDEALDYMEGVAHQYSAFPPPGRDPWLAAVDGTERYGKLLERARADREAYLEQYRAARRV